jgi:hypothetical protein
MEPEHPSRNHFHTHDDEPEVNHTEPGNAPHEHWVSKDGVPHVYYPHVSRVVTG